MMLKTLYWENKKNIQFVSSALKKNEVILGMSDTIIGLFAACTKTAAQKLNQIKRREGKPYLILINSPEQLKLFSPVESFQLENLIDAYWPGPLTIIVPAKQDLPSFMKSPEGTVALRVPNHKGLLLLLKDFSGLFSTSANITGEPIPQTIEDVSSDIRKEVKNIIIDHHQEQSIVPSTIIDFSTPSIRIVREGKISKSDVEKVLGQKL